MKLKKSFQLDKESSTYSELCKTSALVMVYQGMMTKGKNGVVETLQERNKLLQETLLEMGYIIHSEDKLLFFEQTGEIRVMSNDDNQVKNGKL